MDGKPCPVCGSTVHPEKASCAKKELSEAALKKSLTRWQIICQAAWNGREGKVPKISLSAKTIKGTGVAMSSGDFRKEISASGPESTDTGKSDRTF